jgi:DNA-binding protein Fis
MAIGKRLLVFSSRDPNASALVASMSQSGNHTVVAATIEELRAKIEGGDFDAVLVEDSKVLKRLVSEADPEGELLKLPLAEVEKRHIMRVVEHTSGNKTRAARVLGIDTKTLYNKLKTYSASVRRVVVPPAQSAQQPQQQQQQQNSGAS